MVNLFKVTQTIQCGRSSFKFFFFHSLTLKKMNIEQGYEHVRSKMGVRRLFLDPRRLIFTHVLTEMNVIEDIRAVAV